MPPFDPDLVLKQITVGVLMSCGARDFLVEKTGARPYLQFRVGPRGKLAKIVVTLDPSDTYTVRYVEIGRRSLQTEVDEEIERVTADRLAHVVRRMGDR